jgi:hypothetical protein
MPPPGQALEMDGDEHSPTEVLFVTSNVWHQFPDDQRKGLFRNYATPLTPDGQKMVDVPTNVFLMNCKGGERYLTIHFPARYRFDTFTPSTQMRTEVKLHDGRASSTFAAELRDNEFVISLHGKDLDAVMAVLKTQTYQALFGPSQELVSFAIGDAQMDAGQQIMLDMMSGSRKEVTTDELHRYCAR